MTIMPDKKRWSIRTSYPSVAKRHSPPEVSSHSIASAYRLERELENSNRNITKVHRTTMKTLNHKRKIMEKSMLKYTERMKEITDSRTTVLFKRILEQKCNTGSRDVLSEPILRLGGEVYHDSESSSFGENLNKHTCRTVNCKCPFYGVSSKKFRNNYVDSEGIAEAQNDTTHSTSDGSSEMSVLPTTALPRLLLKRSSSADLLKLSLKTHPEYGCRSERRSVQTVFRTRC